MAVTAITWMNKIVDVAIFLKVKKLNKRQLSVVWLFICIIGTKSRYVISLLLTINKANKHQQKH
jgi:hypothetical protein